VSESSRLAAEIDGAPLPEEEARALWKAFSEHMDANKGDMAGFAKQKGFFTIKPEYREGRAVLMAYTKEPPPAPVAPAKPRGGRPGGGRPGGGKFNRGKPGKPGKPKRK